MAKISVRIIPNAQRSELVGKDQGVWRVRITAPPFEGRANAELLRFLGHLLGVAPSEIRILLGHASKTKLIEIPMALADIEQNLKDAI